MNDLWMIPFWGVILFLFIMYVKNLLCIKKDIQNEEYSFKLLFRVGGVFFPVLGIFMGFLK